jgi:monoamine oxidase
VRNLIENVIRTEYGVEPEQSSALQLLFILPAVVDDNLELLSTNDETYVIEGGTGKIIDSFAQLLTGQIKTKMRLNRLQKQSNSYLLTFDNNQVIQADWVILAIPVNLIKNIDIQIDLPAKMRRYLAEVSLGSNEKLIAGFNQRIWLQEDGFSQEIWTDLGFSAAWNETERQNDLKEGALTFFLGGDEVKATQTMTTNNEGNQRISQINQILPGVKQVANQQFVKTQWTKSPFSQGSYTNFQPGQLTEFSEFFYIEENGEISQDGRVDKLIFAGEHFSDEFYGYMNGAAQTGRLAASLIVS